MVNLWLRQATTTVFSFIFERTKQIIVRVTELWKNNLVFSLKCGNKWQRTLGRQLLNFNLDRAPPFYVTMWQYCHQVLILRNSIQWEQTAGAPVLYIVGGRK